MIAKEDLRNKCLEMLNVKITALQKILHDLQQSAANETKSTAGDKHETALAMLQIEQENTGRQLQVLLSQRLQLQQLDLLKSATIIGKGSLVYTNKGLVFISVGIGKFRMGNHMIMVISYASPLGSMLVGKKVGETVQCNNIDYRVDEIV